MSEHSHLAPRGHRLATNALFVGVAQASVGILFFVYIYAARVLGAAGFGHFTLALTIATLLMALPSWGTDRYTAIMAARDLAATPHLVAENLGLTTLLALLYVPLVWVASAVVGDTALAAVALVLAGDHLARKYVHLLRFMFRVHDLYALEAVSAFADRLFIAVAAFGILLLRPTPLLLATAFVGGRLAGAVVTTVLYRRRVGRLGLRFQRRALWELFRAGAPLAARSGLSRLSFRVDLVLLGAMRPAIEVGWYGAVYKLIDGLLMLPVVVSGSLGPPLSANYAAGQRDVLTRLYRRGLKYLLVAGLFLTLTLVILAEPIVRFMYGDEYLPAEAALRLLAAAALFLFVRSLVIELLDCIDLRTSTVSVFLAGLATNVVLNLLLIPGYGFLGAAAATVITEALLVLLLLRLAAGAGYRSDIRRMARGPIAAAAAAGFVLWGLAEFPVAAVAVAAPVYFLLLTATGVWDAKDRDAVRRLARNAARRVTGRGGERPGPPAAALAGERDGAVGESAKL